MLTFLGVEVEKSMGTLTFKKHYLRLGTPFLFLKSFKFQLSNQQRNLCFCCGCGGRNLGYCRHGILKFPDHRGTVVGVLQLRDRLVNACFCLLHCIIVLFLDASTPPPD